MADTLRGIGVSPGAAVGPALKIEVEPTGTRRPGTPLEERHALEQAVSGVAAYLQNLGAHLRGEGHESEAGILEAQSLMAQDPSLLELAQHAIAEGRAAHDAIADASKYYADLLAQAGDPYLAARALDVHDVSERIQRSLSGRGDDISLDRPSIVIARELTPSHTASLDRALVLALATDRGSPTSHTAILARALGIPAVVGLGDLSERVLSGQRVAVNGGSGTVIVDPDSDQIRDTYEEAERAAQRAAQLRSLVDQTAETLDGRLVDLAANIGTLEDLAAARDVGARSVGLFRTEFLFGARDQEPTEEEQAHAYRTALQAMPERVVIRTLDVGGDKPLPYLPSQPEANPFLGERGIRYTFRHYDILRRQLRALVAAAGGGRLSVMLPMVSDVDQILEVRRILTTITGDESLPFELGIMIEIPGAAVLADQLAPHVDFFSVGSNDLVQYVLAVDRVNDRVAELYRPLHPGVLRLMKMAVDAAHGHGKWVGICGEIAGDIQAIPILIGLGFDELSMTPASILEARARIRALNASDCAALAANALECASADEVEILVRQRIPG